MTLRHRFLLAAVTGLGLSLNAGAQDLSLPGVAADSTSPRVVASNQKIAETIAEQLRLSGQLQQYRIDVAVQHGTAELSGTISDESQRADAVRLAQAVPGVERVVDHLRVGGMMSVQQVQAMAPGQQEIAPLPRRAAEPAPAASGPTEPLPMGAGYSGAPLDLAQPRMPPYAWPTYAPYNNYSRVACPTTYPYQAWPYIGPNYPFPKIPLGWRKVSLEWQDGHWWYGQNSSSHDWWRLRYW